MNKLSFSHMLSKVGINLHRCSSKSNIESTARMHSFTDIGKLSGKKVFYTNTNTGESGFGILSHQKSSFFSNKSGLSEQGFAFNSLSNGTLKITDSKLGQGGEMQGLRMREATKREKQQWSSLN